MMRLTLCRHALMITLLATAVLITGCGGMLSTRDGVYQRGEASYYGRAFDGRRTASGEIFSSNRLTAAHRSLAMGSRVRVTNLDNGRHVVVRINDRGPFVRGRIIDLSRRAASRIDMVRSGVAPVELQVLSR